VSKEELRAKFKGKSITLDNAIQALRDRKINLAKEGERGCIAFSKSTRSVDQTLHGKSDRHLASVR
jgi:hypothetical protein